MQKIKKLIPVGLTFAPLVAFGRVNSISDLIAQIRVILIQVVPILIGIAVIFFLVGVVKYITSGDDEEKRTASRNMMIYGIIGIFVMVSVWGLVGILTGTFGTDINVPNIPDQIPFPGNY